MGWMERGCWPKWRTPWKKASRGDARDTRRAAPPDLERRRRERGDELKPPWSWVADQMGLVAVILDGIPGAKFVGNGAELDPKPSTQHEYELLRLVRGRFG